MRTAALVLTLIALTPAAALACPVCGLAGTQDNWGAYRAMTVMLSALPLGMIGGLVFYLYKKSR